MADQNLIQKRSQDHRTFAASDGLAFIDGQFFNLKEASVPLADRGFLFGHSLFETIKVVQGILNPQHFEIHLERLFLSATELSIGIIEPSVIKQNALICCARFNDMISEYLETSPFQTFEYTLKIMVTAGKGFHLLDKPKNPAFYIFCLPPVFNSCKNLGWNSTQRLRVTSVPDTRSPILIHHKTTHYLPAILALESSRTQGFDDFVFYNEQQELTESGTAAFVWIDCENRFNFCSQGNNCLASVTLKRFIQLNVKNVILIREQALHKKEIEEKCKGALFISSIRLARPISSLDHVELNFNLSEEFSELFNRTIITENAKDQSPCLE